MGKRDVSSTDMAALFGFAMFTSNFVWISTSSITTDLHDLFGVEQTWLNYAPCVFYISYILFSFLAVYTLPGMGLRATLMLNASMVLVGTAARLFSALFASSTGFYLLVAGNAVASIPFPWLQNSIGLFSITWYPPEQWSRGTSVLTLAGHVGTCLGYVIPGVLVTDTSKLRWGILNIVIFVFALCSLVATILVAVDAPAVDLSAAATEQAREAKAVVHRPCQASLTTLFSSAPRTYWITVAAFAVLNGAVYWPMDALLEQMYTGFGFSHTDALVAGSTFLVPGLIGMGAMPFVMDHFPGPQTRRILFVSLSLLALVSCVLLTVLLPPSSIGSLGTSSSNQAQVASYVLGALMGFALGGLQPTMLEHALEMAFTDAPTVVASTVVFDFAQVLALTLTVIKQLVSSMDMLIVFSSVLVVPVFASWFAADDRNPRLEYEQKHASKGKSTTTITTVTTAMAPVASKSSYRPPQRVDRHRYRPVSTEGV